jgi:arginyl-tRNA synthetase
MNIEELLTNHIEKASEELYGNKIETSQISFQKTRKEFKGDTTLVTFALTKLSKKSPDATATDLGEYLKKNEPLVTGYNVIKGFLNVELSNKVFTKNLFSAATDVCYGKGENSGKTYIVEYASPNTNKPLHLGHLRNIFLGYSVAEILKACGHQVIKAQIINDRGIHICKSMLAWKKEGKNATPESSGLKGDKLVGHYYVEFEKMVVSWTKKEIDKLVLSKTTKPIEGTDIEFPVWTPDLCLTKATRCQAELSRHT